jgi:hypothetical protein
VIPIRKAQRLTHRIGMAGTSPAMTLEEGDDDSACHSRSSAAGDDIPFGAFWRVVLKGGSLSSIRRCALANEHR